MNNPMQLTAETNSNPDSYAFERRNEIEVPPPGAIMIELLALEPYWEEDSNRQEWQRHVGRSSRKPSLDDYDRWAR